MVDHVNLSNGQSAKTIEERKHMTLVSYASTIGSLMYAMVDPRLDITHTVEILSSYMKNLGKEHWEVVKWFLRYQIGTI